MKNILILLLLIPFLGFTQIQDEYYRVADWTFYPDSIVQLSDTTYSVFAEPANYNDPGSIDRIVGGYVVDFVGHRYVVIDSTDTHLTLFDIFKTGQAPQTGQIAHCYRSVGNGEADFIGSVDYSTLDASARWKINGADNELMWQKVKTKVPYLGAESDVDLGANSISTDTFKIDGVPLLLNTFKQGNLGGASNIFYSTGAISQPASGSLNQVMANNLLNPNVVVKWDGSKFANTGMVEVGGNAILGGTVPTDFGSGNTTLTTNSSQSFAANLVQANGVIGQIFSSSNDAVYLGSRSDHPLNLTINNYTKLRINLDGKIAINKTTADEFLDINGNLIADVLKSRVATGTAPLVVASTTKVDNLNVELLDGKKASDFQLKSDTTTFDATKKELRDSTKYLKENAIGTISISVSGERLALNQTKVVGGAPVSDMIQRVTVDHDGLMTKDMLKRLTDTVPKLSGTLNYLQKVTGTNTIGNSNLIDYGSYVNSSVQFNAPIFYAGSTTYSAGNVDLGLGRTGDNFAYIDFIGDQTYTDYGLRIIRGNTGANTYTQFLHRGTGDFSIKAQDAGRLILGTKNTNALIIDTLQNVGIGAIDTTYELNVVGKINTTGGIFKNGVEITGGSGSTVYPINSGIVTFNGTTWGTSITNNSTLWNQAYDKKIVSAAFSGTSTKTLTLYQQDGNVLQAAFTDESGGTTNWSTDTYGLYYTAGKVGVGANSDVNTWLNVGSLTSTNIGIYGKSQTNPGVRGSSVDYTGVFGSSTDQYGVYGVSTNGYGGGFDKGINIPSGNIDVQGQTRISQGGFFQPVSSSDASAPNNSIYYSTTQSKLVYKNASGTVNVLY